jgi:hypothetical protein
MFRLSAVHMYFSSTIQIQKCTGFKKSSFLRCLDDLQLCSSNVFFIDNPDPDPKLRLKPDPNPDLKNRIHNTGPFIAKASSLPSLKFQWIPSQGKAPMVW